MYQLWGAAAVGPAYWVCHRRDAISRPVYAASGRPHERQAGDSGHREVSESARTSSAQPTQAASPGKSGAAVRMGQMLRAPQMSTPYGFFCMRICDTSSYDCALLLPQAPAAVGHVAEVAGCQDRRQASLAKQYNVMVHHVHRAYLPEGHLRCCRCGGWLGQLRAWPWTQQAALADLAAPSW
jgi:hypothetical protein